MSGPHVDPVMFDRLFAQTGGGPLGADEFEALHLHLDGCPACQERFARERAVKLRGEGQLTEGQAATILNVVLERGRRIEAAGAAAVTLRAVPAPSRPSRRRAWAWGGFGGALTAACAALLLMPASPPKQGQWGVKGGDGAASDLLCFDARTESATSLAGARPVCPPGKTVSVLAHELQGFGWISVVACDVEGCKLIDGQKSAAPTVSLFGPEMAAGRPWTVFTIWSAAPFRQEGVDAAVAAIRARGGVPNAVQSLPLEQPTRQLVATVAADAPPS